MVGVDMLVTAKPRVENWDGLLDSMAYLLRHHLIKAESPFYFKHVLCCFSCIIAMVPKKSPTVEI